MITLALAFFGSGGRSGGGGGRVGVTSRGVSFTLGRGSARTILRNARGLVT